MAKLATYWQRGEAIDYKNETAAVIPANTLLIVGSVLGVAGMDIPQARSDPCTSKAYSRSPRRHPRP